jgi:outer membrane protein assembly factor BamB
VIKFSIFKKMCSIAGLVALILCGSSNATVLYNFEGSTQGWQASGVSDGPWSVSEWANNGSYSLKADITLQDHRQNYLKISKQHNFSGKKFLKAFVNRSSWGNWDVLTAKFYIKTGSSWQWFDGGTEILSSQSKELTIDLSDIPNIADVKEIGVLFETFGNCSNGGSVYVDFVRFEDENEPGTHLWEKRGKALIDNDENIFIVGDDITKVNGATGSNIWFIAIKASSAIIYNNELYVSFPNRIIKLNKNDGTSHWANNSYGILYNESPSDNLLAYTDAGISKTVTNIDPVSGATRWTTTFTADDYNLKINYASSSIIIISGTVSDESGSTTTTYAINTTTGTIIWQNSIGDFMAADQNGIYCRSNDYSDLVKYDIVNGNLLWTLNGCFPFAVKTTSSYLYVTESNFSQNRFFIHSLSLSTGSIVWSTAIAPEQVFRSNIISTGVIASNYRSASFSMYNSSMFRHSDGSMIWSNYGQIFSNGNDVVTISSTAANNYVQLKEPSSNNNYWTYTIPTVPYITAQNLGCDKNNVYVHNYNYWRHSQGNPTEGKLMAINKLTGTLKWSTPFPDGSSFAGANVESAQATSKFLLLEMYYSYPTAVVACFAK